jgi:hypothetical protein
VGLKKEDFWPRINIIKGKRFKKIRGGMIVRQKVPKLYFQGQFAMSKIDESFLDFFFHLSISIYKTIFCKK